MKLFPIISVSVNAAERCVRGNRQHWSAATKQSGVDRAIVTSLLQIVSEAEMDDAAVAHLQRPYHLSSRIICVATQNSQHQTHIMSRHTVPCQRHTGASRIST